MVPRAVGLESEECQYNNSQYPNLHSSSTRDLPSTVELFVAVTGAFVDVAVRADEVGKADVGDSAVNDIGISFSMPLIIVTGCADSSDEFCVSVVIVSVEFPLKAT